MPLKTADNNFGTAKWIVSGAYSDGCTHTTIASALTSASSGDTIFIRPGTYTENLTLKAGVNLTAFLCDAITPNVTIVGKLSMSASGTCSISGIKLQTNSDYAVSCTGASSKIICSGCHINANNNIAIQITNGEIDFRYCSGDISTTGIAYFAQSGGSLQFFYCNLENNGSSTTTNTISAGTLYFRHSMMVLNVTTSSTANFVAEYTNFATYGLNLSSVIHNSSGTVNLDYCFLNGGSAAAATVGGSSTLTLRGCMCNSANASGSITGTGTLNYGALQTTQTSKVAVTTQNGESIITGTVNVDGVFIRSGSGSPSGVETAPKGSLWLRTDGSSSSTRAYINTNGSTGWTAITTAS